ncbi:PAS domain S-box-containing protein [Halovenus aranensis]|uniref:PAS domain S-box-containing protein n=1 Tax=Halovenus aranensis TaxID=890420 RepID=A0A1G8UR91_9EURY|nr:response regulator [Halovenus aranensis]SDJ56174.1 PAS domain S-box-containing protein [Halovenus aranensis]
MAQQMGSGETTAHARGAHEGEIHVLCVDDDELTLELNVEMLERERSDMTVTGLSDPSEVLSFLDRERVDCVVSDYDMPEMNGLVLLESVREQFPDLPFILFTSKGSEKVASDAISAGVTDYLRKGSGAERYDILCNRIENAVARRREHYRRLRAEQWYYQLFEQRLIGVGLSQNQVYQEANGLFADMLGYSREELVGTPVMETVASYDHERVRRALDRREGGKADRVRYIVDIHCRNGDNRTVEVIGSRVEYGGEPAILGLILPADRVGPHNSSRFDAVLEQLDSVRDQLESHGDESVAEAYALATQARERLATLSAGHSSETPASASVEDAVREAWRRTARSESSQLEIGDDTLVNARYDSVVTLVEQIFRTTLGNLREECTVRCQTTEQGFTLRITSPALGGLDDSPLVSDQQMPPDPITDAYWQRGIDIYINRVGEQAVEYEIFITKSP